MTVHITNGRAGKHPHTRGAGETWCGKKLLGQPESVEGATETFSCYGSLVSTSIDPKVADCPRCREAFDAAYSQAFPEGLKPIATFKLGDEKDMERARRLLSPDALRQFFAPGGGGVPALTAAIQDQPA